MGPFKNIFSWTNTLERRQHNHLHIIDELQRCRLLLCCLFCSTGVSIVYIFELFTTEFSNRYGFSAGDLSTISTVGNAFCNFMLPYSFIYELMGPTPLLALALITGFIGMLGLGLIFQNVIQGNLLVICVFYAIMNTCSGLFDTVSIVTLQQTFPRNRGPVLALAKVMTGLGSSVFASISSNLFGENLSGFLYFVMAYAIVVSFVSAFVVVLPPYSLNWWRARKMSPHQKEIAQSLSVVYDSKNMPMPRLIIGYSIVIALIIFFSTSSPIVAYMGISRQARYGIGTITCVLMCAYGIITLPLRCLGGVNEPSPDMMEREAVAQPEPAAYMTETESTTATREAKDATPPPSANPKADIVDLEAAEARKLEDLVEMDVDEVELDRDSTNAIAKHPFEAYMDPEAIKYTDPKYPGTIWDAIRHVDIYLIYLGFILQASIGSIVMYNSSTIYIARTGQGRSNALSALYTAFLGVGTALGRITVGVFEAFVQRQPEGKRRLLITMVLPLPAIFGTVGGVLILLLPGNALLLPFILIYFKEGLFYSTCAIIFPALFSTHLSIYYNLSCATMVISVVCFNRFLFGYVIDQKRASMHLTGECTSRDCILIPIVCSICFCAVAFVLFTIAHIRYLRFVRRCEKKKLEENVFSNADDIKKMPHGGEEALAHIEEQLGRFFDQSKKLEERQKKHLHIIDEQQRFCLLLCCLFCCTGTSIVYTFELFTPEFSSRYNLSAGDQSTISTVSVVFHYFVLPYAVVYERMGPTPLLLLALVTGFVGCLCLSLVFHNVIQGNLVLICVFYAIMNTCSGLFDAASIVTLQQTFPRNRGPVLALAKVMTGLGSSVFASIYSSFFSSNLGGFLYFVMAFCMAVAGVSIFVLVLPPYVVNWWRGRHMTQAEKEAARSLVVVYNSKNVPMPRLILGYVVAIALIIFSAASSPIVAYLNVSRPAQYVIGTIACVLMCCYGGMALPLRCLGGIDEPSPELAASEEDEEVAALAEGAREPPAKTTELPAEAQVELKPLPEKEKQKAKTLKKKKVTMGVDVAAAEETATINTYAAYVDPNAVKYTDPKYPGTIWDALRHVDVYLIYLGFILQGAIGSIVTYNSSTIYVAMTGKSRSQELSSLYTAFLGVGSALGRIAVGVFEAFVQRQPEGKRRLLVTLALPIPSIIGIIGSIFILVLPGRVLLLPFIMIYIKEGFFYSTCAVVFPTLYATHLSIYYILSSATTVVCVICFNRFLFGYMVDKKRVELGETGGDCTSRDCILIPIIVCICFCALAFVMLLIAHIRYTRYVRRCEKNKRREDAYVNPMNLNALPEGEGEEEQERSHHEEESEAEDLLTAEHHRLSVYGVDEDEVHVGAHSYHDAEESEKQKNAL